MTPLFNYRGLTAPDPLDAAPKGMRMIISIAVAALISTATLYLIFFVLNIADLKYNYLFVIEVGFLALIYTPVFVAFRKSGSLVLVAILMLMVMPVDLYIEGHYRALGLPALWTYNPDGLLGGLHPLLRIFVVWLVDGLICGVFVLWVARLVAGWIYGKPNDERALQAALFRAEWTMENIDKPKHGIDFYILRYIGIAYFIYFVLTLLGLLGTAPWPGQIREILEMSYANPALTINTYIKISVMVLLASIGAYNKALRYHCALALLVGHAVSTVFSLFFYFYDTTTDYHSFLLTSAIADGFMMLLFVWVMIKNKQYAKAYFWPKEFPENYSLPHRLNQYFHYIFGGTLACIAIGTFLIRIVLDGSANWGAVYGYPDPQLVNTITKYATLAFVILLLANREALREKLYKVILWPYMLSVLASGLWLLIGDMVGDVRVQTRYGTETEVGWYFMLNVLMDGGVVILYLWLRKMFYNVEYGISATNPSSAQNILALYDTLHEVEEKEKTALLQSIDRFTGGIRGRKRGLMNFPFYLLENLFVLISGSGIGFSSMDREHRQYFLRTRVLRMPAERKKAMIPALADFVSQIGIATHGLITLAHYNLNNTKNKIGYIPPMARDRLQTDYPSAPPPFSVVAGLPNSPTDPLNDKPDGPPPPRAALAPRILTPLADPELPSEVDYLIVGSGAGGATMAYRLACREGIDPSRILLIDRGFRYSQPDDMNTNEMEMYSKLYKEGGLQTTKRFGMTVLQGECVGGTTVINNAICLKMPDSIKKIWTEQYDLDLSGIDTEYEKIRKELEIQPIPAVAINKTVDTLFRNGIEGYNSTVQPQETLHLEQLEVNARNLSGAGLINLGNNNVQKRSMLETYIPWAEARGVRVIGGINGIRFVAEGRKATKVLVRTSLGVNQEIRVKKAVILAGGVIASSHFLMRSGIEGHVGRSVSCNLALPFTYVTDKKVFAFDGTEITHGAFPEDMRAAFETVYQPPAAQALTVPFYFGRHTAVMNNYTTAFSAGALIGSEPGGTCLRNADWLNGRPLEWKLGEKDLRTIKYAIQTLTEIGYHAGAKRAVMPLNPGIELNLEPAEIAAFQRALDAYPLRMHDLRLVTAHPQGGNMMAGDRSPLRTQRVLDATGKLDGYDNVFVADASVFPTGLTVNPQWTIFAMSALIAKAVP